MTDEPESDVEYDRPWDWPAPLAVLRDYWRSTCRERAMPARRDISPVHFKSQLPNVLLVDVLNGGNDFRYRLVGTGLTPFFLSDPSGKPMAEALAPFGRDTVERTIAGYRAIVDRRAPLRITGSGSIYGQTPKMFDAWLAPLSDDGETVNIIIGSFVFVWDVEHRFAPPERLAMRA